MLEHGEEGHIVNTASLAALMPGGSPYSVSKHGVLALSEGLYRNLKDLDAKIGASVLCPGFVATKIMDAERNRPKDLDTEAPPPDEGAAAMAQAMLAQGMTPAAVADIVFEAIEEERFYILPHPAWDATLRGWFDNVLARGVPAMPDIEDMMRRRAAGEQF